MTGEFLLTWYNHWKNVSEAFSSLRKDVFFCDVTLACQDQQFKAHKVVLAASSPFFEKVLQDPKHPNPLIYLKGVEVKHMEWPGVSICSENLIFSCPTFWPD